MDPIIGQIILFGGNFAPRGWAMCNGQLMSIAQNSALFSLLGTTYGGDGRTTFALPDLRGRAPIGMGQGPGLTPVQQGQQAGQEKVTIALSNLPAHNHEVDFAKPARVQPSVTINTTVQSTIAFASAKGNFPATSVPVTDGKITIPVSSSNRGNTETSPNNGVLAPYASGNFYASVSNAKYKEDGTLVGAVAKIPQTPLDLPVSGSVNVPINTNAPVVGVTTTSTQGSTQPMDIRTPYIGMNYCIALEGIYPSRD